MKRISKGKLQQNIYEKIFSHVLGWLMFTDPCYNPKGLKFKTESKYFSLNLWPKYFDRKYFGIILKISIHTSNSHNFDKHMSVWLKQSSRQSRVFSSTQNLDKILIFNWGDGDFWRPNIHITANFYISKLSWEVCW